MKVELHVKRWLLLIDLISGPLTSPDKINLLVVASVSHATLLSLNLLKYKSRTVSEIISQSLSGCPSETDSLVKI